MTHQNYLPILIQEMICGLLYNQGDDEGYQSQIIHGPRNKQITHHAGGLKFTNHGHIFMNFT